MQKILHTTGAFLRQFLVDDKGCVLIACWGMPSLSYLDNPHRALSAAAQIRNKFSKSNMKCSIGITTGDVYCGTVGSAVRMEYAAIGNVVNMSARLMGKADEDILIDHETYLRLPDSVQKSLEPMSPMMVKGRDVPLQAYRYSAESSIFIGDDVVEDHEVREVCKTTFIKLLDRMKAPGRFSHYKRRQSIVKMKDWISGSVRRGGDLLSLSTTSNKMNETSRRGSLLRSSFQMSFRGGSSTRGSTRGSSRNNNEEGSSYRSSPSIKSPRSGQSIPQRRGSNAGAYASNRNPGVYQHDDSSHRNIPEIPYVLMEGRRGAGKSSIVNWLKKQATDRQIPVYRARLTKNDVVVDYSLWMKVFRQMMPKDMFKTKELQEKYVTQLLTELYHDDLDTIEFVAFPSMKRAFGVNCDLELLNRDKSFDLSFGDTVKPKRKKIVVTSRVVTGMGGTVKKSLHVPLNTADYSSYLLQAQASGAKIIGLANGGTDTVNAIKQAHEFGIVAAGQRLAGMLILLSDVKSIGVDIAKDLHYTDGWYWDMDDVSRNWKKRYLEFSRNAAPTAPHAAIYSATMAYLQAVRDAGTDRADAVRAKLGAMKIDDFYAKGGAIRADGMLIHDMYLLKVKADGESEWDLSERVATIPGEQAYISPQASECAALK